MIVYDKYEVREELTMENIFELLEEWGGEPLYTTFGIISATICHNPPGEGSHKLYWYKNTGLCHCYTGCEEPSFDIFELTRKVMKIQYHEDYDLNDAVRWVAARFGIAGRHEDDEDDDVLLDWKILANYDKIQKIELKENHIILKEYNNDILNKFNYEVKISPWLNEDISEEVMRLAQIGYYPGNEQITIPHFDLDNRFIGLRGRTLIKDEAELYGKYRPIKINKIQYSHPLGMNLYGYNWSKKNIEVIKKAIIFESEKSVLKYASYFGWDNNISVACCGSNVSAYQVELLIQAGATEIVIALDRQFKELGDDEFKKLTKNLIRLREKYKNEVLVSFIFDKKMITNYKSSPIDEGSEKFLKLFNERIVL